MSTAIQLQPIPSPWRSIATFAVGGLYQIGFADDSDLLLVLSYSGAGVFDCITGTRIARDPDYPYDLFDTVRLLAKGIGPLAGKSIRMAGLHGGALSKTTLDQWFVDAVAHQSTSHVICLSPPPPHQGERVPFASDGATELRAYGFSITGKSLVVASSSDLDIFNRP